MSDSAARHRARQTVINLVLALAACVALVVVITVTLPRNESNRVKAVDYSSVVTQAANSSKLDLVNVKLPANWWCNLAQLTTNNVDTVPVFKAGFVGSDTKYIGYTQALNANPTWLALGLNGMTLTGTKTYGVHSWDIYESVVKHDPKKTMDYVMVLKYTSKTSNENYVLLYGVAEPSEFDFFANQITTQAWAGVTVID